MNTKQQIATGLMALLMFATIVLMPATFHSQATYSASVVRQTGASIAQGQVQVQAQAEGESAR